MAALISVKQTMAVNGEKRKAAAWREMAKIMAAAKSA
jgi:hypothetical protein